MLGCVKAVDGVVEAIEVVHLVVPDHRSCVRQIRGAPVGGAIRLAPAPLAGTLALAVSIEAGIRIQRAFSVPVWCAMLPARLGCIDIPDSVERLVLFTDETGPDGGREAAQGYMAKGFHVDIEQPDGHSWES